MRDLNKLSIYEGRCSGIGNIKSKGPEEVNHLRYSRIGKEPMWLVQIYRRKKKM